MKFTLVAACLVAGIAYSSCFVHSMPKHRFVDQEIEEIECPKEGDFFYPHPDCTKYYWCTNGRLFIQNCGGGLFWNPAKNECDFQEAVPECIGATRETDGPTDAPEPTEPATTPAPVTTEAPVTTPAPVTTEAPVTTDAPITTGAPVTTDAPVTTNTDAPVTTPEAEVTTPEAEVTTRDPSNPCVEDGIYTIPSAEDCADYTQCIYGDAYPARCASGLLFDPSIGKCNKEELVVCYEAPTTPAVTTPAPITTEEPPTTEAPICEPEGVYNVPFPQNCSLYILCAHGVPIIQECADDLSFDPIELTCVREEVSTCVGETITTTVEPEVTTTEVPEDTTTVEPETEAPSTVRPPVRCEFDGVYKIPAPEGGDCSTYYLCINYVPYIQSCAEGTLFSPNAGQCVREENYTCPSESGPTTAAPVTTEPPTTTEAAEPTTTVEPTTVEPTTVEPTTVEPTTPVPVTTEAPATTPGNELTCPEDGVGTNYYPHPTSCRLFYSCKGPQFDRVYDCGTGYWFDSASQACVYPQNSDCKVEPLP